MTEKEKQWDEAESYEAISVKMEKEGYVDKVSLYLWLKIPRKTYFELATRPSTKCIVPECEYHKEKGKVLCGGHWESYQEWCRRTLKKESI